MAGPIPVHDMTRILPHNTWLYFLAQSINLTCAVMSVTMAPIASATLAPDPWMSTIPYGCQFLFVMLMTYPASRIMAATGRKKAFLLATLPLAASGIAGFLAIEKGTFILLVISHCLLGTYIAFANFNRFAATDGIASTLKSLAISLVVAGGVVAAIIGPLLTSQLKDIEGLRAFSACYGAFIGLAVISLILNLLTSNTQISARKTHEVPAHSVSTLSIVKNKAVLSAIAIAAVGYGLMNLLMIQASMHMSHMHVHFSDISAAIQWHVLAMFAPSFITGRLMQRFGLKTIVFVGIVLILASSALNIASADYAVLTASLIMLGVGWNFTYVGGSALLAHALEETPEHAMKVQGLNDLGISIMATAGAFAPAFLLTRIGWTGTNLLSMLLCVVLLAFSAIGLSRRHRSPLVR